MQTRASLRCAFVLEFVSACLPGEARHVFRDSLDCCLSVFLLIFVCDVGFELDCVSE